jgi:hypothetical protein
MSSNKLSYQPVLGSNRAVPSGARRVRDAARDAPVEVTIGVLRAAEFRIL